MRDADIKFPLVISEFGGWVADRDVVKVPGANAVDGFNVDITSSGSIKSAPQYQLVGTDGGVGSSPITSSTLFKTRYNESMEVFHSGTALYYWNTKTSDYATLKSGLSSGAFFGFSQSSENSEFNDFLYMGNAIDNDMRWNGAHDKLQTALNGAVTELEISSSIFTSTVHVSSTATSCTDTTITLSTANWGTNVFANFYVEIIDGVNAGKVAKITSNTGTILTFASISGLSGTPQFKIRTLRFSHTGSLIVGSQEIAYTGYTSSTKFTISGTYTIAANTPVAQTVTEYPDNPKGNMMLMKDGYRLVASTLNSTIYRSRVFDHNSFALSSPRQPGQGDIIDVVEGTGNLTGLVSWKGYFLAVKKDLVKPYSYTAYNQASGATDGNDVISSSAEDTRQAPLIGGSYPLGTFEVDNAVVSCITGRGFRLLVAGSSVVGTSTDELSADISDVANLYVSDTAAGKQHLDLIWVATKVDSSSEKNDVVLSFNTRSKRWNLPRLGWSFSSFFEKNGSLYATSAQKRAVFKLNETLNLDMNDGESYTNQTLVVSGAMRGTTTSGKRSNFAHQYIRGRMNLATELTVTRMLEINGALTEETARISYSLNPDCFQVVDDTAFLGSDELGRYPLGSAGSRESNDFTDMYPFIAYIEWKPKTVNEWQIAFSTDGAGQEFEILEEGFNTSEEPTIDKRYLITPGE